MAYIYNSLQELISPDLISKGSSYLHEDSSKTASAINSTIAGLFFSILPKEDSSEVEFAIRKAGRAYPNILSKLDDVFTGNADEKTYYAGSRLLDGLFENRINTFTSLISSESGLSIISTDKLISMVAPVVAGYLGNKILTEKISFTQLLKALEEEKESYQNYIPSELPELLEMAGNPTVNSLPFSINPDNVTNIPSEQHKIRRGFSLGKWITVLLIVAAVIYWWKSCQ